MRVFIENYQNYLRNNMERKPYYVLRPYNSGFKLHEGVGRKVYPHSGNAIQLYLTDEEEQKYNSEAVQKSLKPYMEVTLKRYMYMPVELIIYAICEVLYD